jgi:hypothetical protein
MGELRTIADPNANMRVRIPLISLIQIQIWIRLSSLMQIQIRILLLIKCESATTKNQCGGSGMFIPDPGS